METIGNPWLWAGFGGLVVIALLVDLVLMRHGGAHKVTFKEAAWWSLGWVALAMIFNGALWWYVGQTAGAAEANRVGLEFLTGYLVEKALAVDNIFVFLMLFTYFAVPEEQRQRVLVIGILGAIVLRAILIFVGAALLAKFHWLLYLFGAFLLLTGIKMWFAAGKEPDLDKNPVLRWITGHLPLINRYHGDALWLGRGKRRRYTPLFVVLVMIAVTDVIFAVDSIPAIFAITSDPFIVLTSNVFAVLGLHGGPLPPAALRPGRGAGLHRQQDAAGGRVQDPGAVVAGHGGDDPGRDRGAEPGAAAEGRHGRLTAIPADHPVRGMVCPGWAGLAFVCPVARTGPWTCIPTIRHSIRKPNSATTAAACSAPST